MWRRGNSGDVGCGLGPDQLNRAGGVIYDEAGGVAQALRAEPGPVAVSCHDEKVCVRGRTYDGPFGPTLNFDSFAAAPEPVRGRLEQVARRRRGQLVAPGPRVVPAPPEQTKE